MANSSAKSSLFARPGGGGDSAAAKLWARIWRDFFSTAFTSAPLSRDNDNGQMKKTIADRQTDRQTDVDGERERERDKERERERNGC